jgi:alpha-mannosidase
MNRTAHYVVSTHWDREWYEPFQGFRMRLVKLLAELFATFDSDPTFRSFVLDGQSIPIADYLEIHPEQRERIRGYVASGRLKLGPWYVMPDEFILSGESLIRNLEHGLAQSAEYGEPSRAGMICDIFGHISQLPQIFSQFRMPAGFLFRGVNEKEHGGNFRWRGADGTVLPCYRFGITGYSNFAVSVRSLGDASVKFEHASAVDKFVAAALVEAKRCTAGPILLFDSSDHLEITPGMSAVVTAAAPRLAEHGIKLVFSDLDAFGEELAQHVSALKADVSGELRETGRDDMSTDQHWLIPGVLSSRIHLKQRNAACEDELCLWAEPFSAFAAGLGRDYPDGYLRVSWRHLLENHPHDSICGCSIDEVHQDMIYRFDQSLGISSRLTKQALTAIARASAPLSTPERSLTVTVFNSTADDIDEMVDLDVRLPTDWPKRFSEFFGYEEKFSFRIRDAAGNDIPWQLVNQLRDRMNIKVRAKKYPDYDPRHIVSVCLPLRIPAFGWTTLVVEPVDGPTRHLGSMANSHRTIANDALRVSVNANGTLAITDLRNGHTFDQALTFEQCADTGDGWFHGVAVNDQVYLSSAAHADVAVIADGFAKATLRISVTMQVPEEFDFPNMRRSQRLAPLTITSEVTLRRGSDRVEITCRVENTVRDHRLRVLFPTGLAGDSMVSDSAFDVIERPIALAADNAMRRELDVETRPQQTWTAFADGKNGLAVVSRGLPECAVRATPDRPIALTLLRAFRRAVFASMDQNPGGQIQGPHTFRFAIVPFSGAVPARRLFLLGQRMLHPTRAADLLPDQREGACAVTLPQTGSFISVDGDVIVTSIRQHAGALQVRLFNPSARAMRSVVKRGGKSVALRALTLGGDDDKAVRISDGGVELPAKHITTLSFD